MTAAGCSRSTPAPTTCRCFAVSPAGLALASRTASGGTLPISLTVHGNVLYVLNAGGSGKHLGLHSRYQTVDLTPTRAPPAPLGSSVGPPKVQFSPDGSRLVVTEKNHQSARRVRRWTQTAWPSGPRRRPPPAARRSGSPSACRNDLFRVGTTGSASSYGWTPTGTPALVSGAVSTHQGAPCWAVVTADGRFGFTSGQRGRDRFGLFDRAGRRDQSGGRQRRDRLDRRRHQDIALSTTAATCMCCRTGGARDPRVPRRGGRAPLRRSARSGAFRPARGDSRLSRTRQP